MLRFFTALLLGALVACSGPALSEGTDTPPAAGLEVPLLVRLEIREVSDAELATLKSQGGRIQGPVPGRLLQAVDNLSVSGQDTLVHLGKKHPIVYYDPRASQFQVQYVDTGLKLDVRCRTTDGQSFSIDTRPELGIVIGSRTGDPDELHGTYPTTRVFISETVLDHVIPGETLLLGRLGGAQAEELLRVIGRQPAAKHLIATFTLERI